MSGPATRTTVPVACLGRRGLAPTRWSQCPGPEDRELLGGEPVVHAHNPDPPSALVTVGMSWLRVELSGKKPWRMEPTPASVVQDPGKPAGDCVRGQFAGGGGRGRQDQSAMRMRSGGTDARCFP